MTEYTLNYAQINEAISTILEARLVPFITSSPGMGKSSIIKSIAEKYDMELIDIRLSMLEAFDLQGIPNFTKEGKAYFAPFNLFPLVDTPLPEGKKAFLLFLDEFNSATKQVAAASYKLILDRKVGNYDLHPDCYIVCAGNKTSDRAIVNNMGTAMQTRLIHLSLEVSFDDWLNTVGIPYAYDYRITSFLSQYPALLNNFNPEHTVNTYAVPRTWGFCNELIKGRELTSVDTAILAGTIGTEVALQFVQYTKVYANLPSMQSIIENPETAILPKGSASRWAIMSILLEHVDADNIENIAKYTERFSMDLRIYFLRLMSKQHPKLMANKAMTATILSLSKYLNQ